MAITMVLQVATAYRLKYLVTYDGAGGAGSGGVVKTRAQLIADLDAAAVASPLKALLQATTDNTLWDGLDKGAFISVYITKTTGGGALSANLETVVPDGNCLNVTGVDGTSYQALVEVKYNHSIDR